ncbi:MAG TPA: XRE family transcriptional regulator, partial [Spirillospora sp.]
SAQVGTVTETTPDLGSDEMRRRAALQLLTAVSAGAVIPPGALEQILSGIDAALGNPVDLDDWDRVVQEYGQRLIQEPPGALVTGLTADIVAVGELLKRHLAEHERAGLLRVAAGLSGLLAMDLGDVGDQRAARVTWATARRAADRSGDQALRVWVRGRAAQDAAWAGRPASVVEDLADEALLIAGGTALPGAARALAARAYLAADQGDTAAATAALDDLTDMFDRLPPSGGQMVLAYAEPQLRWAHAYVQTWTGNPRAADTAQEAIAMYPAGAAGPIANLKLMQAAAMVQAREVTAGLEQALTTMQRFPPTTARTSVAKHILRTLPSEARELSAAKELHAITTGA